MKIVRVSFSRSVVHQKIERKFDVNVDGGGGGGVREQKTISNQIITQCCQRIFFLKT